MRAPLLLFALAAFACADEVHLRDGRVIEGKVSEEGDTIRVQGEHGSVSFRRDQVLSITHGPTHREEYASRLAALADTDAEGHFQLASWCEAVGLMRERDKELARTLEIDSQHEGANQILGRVKWQGKWMTAEEAADAQGLVNWGGQWIPREEKRLRDEMAAAASIDHQVRKRTLELTIVEAKGNAVDREEAEVSLSAVPNEVRLRALCDAIPNEDPEVRSFAAKGAALLGGKEVVPLLAERLLYENDKDVFLAIAGAIRGIAAADPAPFFAEHLADRDVEIRIRAEYALGEFPSNKDAAPGLVDMLENTTHYQGGAGVIIHGGDVPSRPGVPPPPDPLPVDEGTVMMERERKAILYALAKITGVNMGLDIARWRVILEVIRKKDDKGK